MPQLESVAAGELEDHGGDFTEEDGTLRTARGTAEDASSELEEVRRSRGRRFMPGGGRRIASTARRPLAVLRWGVLHHPNLQ